MRAMLFDQNGYLWVGGSGGLVRWDVAQKTYEKFTSEDGLASNFVTSIVQTPDGNLWFGTYGGGVSRYDGTAWKTFTTADGLPENHILAMAVSPQEGIWVGTTSESAFFDGETWINYSEAPFATSSIAIENDGSVWMGSYIASIGTLMKYDGVSWKSFTDNLPVSLNTESKAVTALKIGPDDILWVGMKGGLASYDGTSWQAYPVPNPDTDVQAIQFDSHGNLWLGYSINSTLNTLREEAGDSYQDWFPGVSRFDGATWETFGLEDGLGSQEVRAMTTKDDSSLWFGTYNRGVFRYDGDHWKQYQTENEPFSNDIYSLTTSVSGELWLGYHTNVSFFDGQTWQAPLKIVLDNGDQIEPFAFRSMAQGQNLWFLTLEGLLLFDQSKWTLYSQESFTCLKFIRNVAQTSDGTLYVVAGLREGQLYHFDYSQCDLVDKFSGMNLTDIAIQSDGDILIGTQNDGLYIRQNLVWQQQESEELLSNSILAIASGLNDTIWLLTPEELARYDGQRWTISKLPSYFETPIDRNSIRAVLADSTRGFWIGTENGLAFFNGQDWTYYTSQDGLADNSIHALSIGYDGCLWVATQSGLSRFTCP